MTTCHACEAEITIANVEAFLDADRRVWICSDLCRLDLDLAAAETRPAPPAKRFVSHIDDNGRNRFDALRARHGLERPTAAVENRRPIVYQ